VIRLLQLQTWLDETFEISEEEKHKESRVPKWNELPAAATEVVRRPARYLWG
jgi:hypothetical protein